MHCANSKFFSKFCFIVFLWAQLSDAQLPAALPAAYSQTPISREISDRVIQIPDLAFAQYGELTLELDLYRPVDNNNRLPVIVLIQGGGHANGSKDTFGPIAAAFAKKGFAAVSIDYRGFGQALFPGTVSDVQKAIDWINNNQDQYLLNADKIGVFGGSYGGLISVYAGLISDDAEVWQAQKNIDAIVGFSAIADLSDFASESGFGERLLGVSFSDDPRRWAKASSINLVTSKSPPLLLIASDTDKIVPPNQSITLADKYQSVGAEVQLHILPKAHHAFWNYKEWFTESINITSEFYSEHLSK